MLIVRHFTSFFPWRRQFDEKIRLACSNLRHSRYHCSSRALFGELCHAPSLSHPWRLYFRDPSRLWIQSLIYLGLPCFWPQLCNDYHNYNEERKDISYCWESYKNILVYFLQCSQNTYFGQNSSASSKSSSTSFLKTFLHFLQAKVISRVLSNSWSCVSAWHSGQSNHFLQHGALMETWALRMCLHILFGKYVF